MKNYLSKYNVSSLVNTVADSNTVTKEYVNSIIDNDTRYRWAYIPFIVADIMRDYLDSCYDIASIMRLSEVKKIIREIKDTENEYVYRRKQFFDNNYLDNESKNAYKLQDDITGTFGFICKKLGEDIEKSIGTIILDKKMFIIAGYMAEIIYEAICRYTADYINIIEDRFSLKTINIMPPVFNKLGKLIKTLNKTYCIIDKTRLDIYVTEIKYIIDSIVLFEDDVRLEKVV